MADSQSRFPRRYLFPTVFRALAFLSAGAALWASRHEAATHPEAAPQSGASPTLAPDTSRSPLADIVAEQEQEGPPAPRFVTEYGIRLEDEDHVRRLLNGSVRCMFWTGAYSDQSASLLDLMRLRKSGYASLPTDYEVHHEQRDGADYVVVRGSDLRGMPGYVDHLYLDAVQRGRFEHISSTPEDPDFSPAMLREVGDPVGFLVMHSDAVCNGRRTLPEVRAELMQRQRQIAPTAQRADGESAAQSRSQPAGAGGAVTFTSIPPPTAPHGGDDMIQETPAAVGDASAESHGAGVPAVKD